MVAGDEDIVDHFGEKELRPPALVLDNEDLWKAGDSQELLLRQRLCNTEFPEAAGLNAAVSWLDQLPYFIDEVGLSFLGASCRRSFLEGGPLLEGTPLRCLSNLF